MTKHSQKRQHQRISVSLAVELRYSGSMTTAKVRDLSEGGAGLMLRKPIPEDIEVEVFIVLAEDGIADPTQPPLECRAKVMWSAEQETGQVAAGIRFVELDESAKLRVRWFLAQLDASQSG